MSKHVRAVYPGTFDPVTNGHLEIIRRARRVVSHLTVAVFENQEKQPLFPLETRIELLQDCIPANEGIAVESFSGELLVDYCREHGIGVIVRGLRAITDFEYEFQMDHINQQLAPDIETIFLMTTHQYSYLSSSVIKEVAKFGGDIGTMVPPAVAKALAHQLV